MKQKISSSHSFIKPWAILVLLMVFLSVSIFNQTPFTKDLTDHPSAEVLLEANALTFIKKTYKILAPAHIYDLFLSLAALSQDSQLKEIIKDTSDHFFEIDRIHSMYSNIPPPSLS